jgi:hypothetical protein
MRFPEKKWIFAGMLPTIVLLVMVTSVFSETPGFPPGYEDIEPQILTASQESTTVQRCSVCHGWTNIFDPHHNFIPNWPEPGPSDSPYNPYCPEQYPYSFCEPCHYHYDDNCEQVWPNPHWYFGNGCAACHALSESCTYELEPPTAECIAEIVPGACHQPQTPPEMIQELTGSVIELNLQQGISNSLDAKLETALSALDDVNTNNDVAAINSLNAFINAVEAQRGNKITNEDADALIAAAQAIIDSLQSQ